MAQCTNTILHTNGIDYRVTINGNGSGLYSVTVEYKALEEFTEETMFYCNMQVIASYPQRPESSAYTGNHTIDNPTVGQWYTLYTTSINCSSFYQTPDQCRFVVSNTEWGDVRGNIDQYIAFVSDWTATGMTTSRIKHCVTGSDVPLMTIVFEAYTGVSVTLSTLQRSDMAGTYSHATVNGTTMTTYNFAQNAEVVLWYDVGTSYYYMPDKIIDLGTVTVGASGWRYKVSSKGGYRESDNMKSYPTNCLKIYKIRFNESYNVSMTVKGDSSDLRDNGTHYMVTSLSHINWATGEPTSEESSLNEYAYYGSFTNIIPNTDYYIYFFGSIGHDIGGGWNTDLTAIQNIGSRFYHIVSEAEDYGGDGDYEPNLGLLLSNTDSIFPVFMNEVNFYGQYKGTFQNIYRTEVIKIKAKVPITGISANIGSYQWYSVAITDAEVPIDTSTGLPTTHLVTTSTIIDTDNYYYVYVAREVPVVEPRTASYFIINLYSELNQTGSYYIKTLTSMDGVGETYPSNNLLGKIGVRRFVNTTSNWGKFNQNFYYISQAYVLISISPRTEGTYATPLKWKGWYWNAQGTGTCVSELPSFVYHLTPSDSGKTLYACFETTTTPYDWDTPKTQGELFNITANEWNRLIKYGVGIRNNVVRACNGNTRQPILPNVTEKYLHAVSGGIVKAGMCSILGASGTPEQSGDVITASRLNQVKTYINTQYGL